MMDSSTKKMIVRLIEETSTRRISWEIGDAPQAITRGTDDVFPLFFRGSFKGNTICIYQEKGKRYLDDREHYWNETLVIGILDREERLVWDYQGNEPELHELFTDVRRSVSDVDRFLSYFR